MTSNGPIRIAATRGGAVESVHSVHAVVAGPNGDATHVFGDPDRVVFPRSSLKAIQALPLIESGAADHFVCSPAELALACASHEGEGFHTDTVTAWLDRIGLDPEALACGPQWPRRDVDYREMVLARQEPGRVHNNCSGKHTGMLATALHLGEAPAGYASRAHNVQKRVFEAVEALSGESLDDAPVGIDGCSAPNPALPIRSLAVAAARFAEASPERLGHARADACRRLLNAMVAAPEMVGGTDRFDTDLIRVYSGRVMSKTGAEGFYMLYLPERRLGIALKAEDGTPRASTAAVWSVLERLGLLDGQAENALRHHCRPEIRNCDGLVTGEIVDIS
ncbi:MAG: asparaginase [Minwuia sp.]|uniref:asparaginase n=1 Tax=Minwuia sp. TaxID=2493630 RepID=UPI003A8B815C